MPLISPEADARGRALRTARAHSKRALKSGAESLAQALEADHWQDKLCYEVVGYAIVSRTTRPDSKKAPHSAGVWALKILSRMQPAIGHWTKVSALSPQRRAALCAAVEASGHEARLRLVEPSSSS
jgi:hypothetical protein